MARTEDIKITALYERLPRKDGGVGKPNSTKTQKLTLEESAGKQGRRNSRPFGA